MRPQLARKTGRHVIETVRGLGYRMRVGASWALKFKAFHHSGHCDQPDLAVCHRLDLRQYPTRSRERSRRAWNRRLGWYPRMQSNSIASPSTTPDSSYHGGTQLRAAAGLYQIWYRQPASHGRAAPSATGDSKRVLGRLIDGVTCGIHRVREKGYAYSSATGWESEATRRRPYQGTAGPDGPHHSPLWLSYLGGLIGPDHYVR